MKKYKLIFFISGLLAAAWVLIRVIPKPARAVYPCQRAAIPIASAFIIWLLGIKGLSLAYKKMKHSYREKKLPIFLFALTAIILCGTFTLLTPFAIRDLQANSPADSEGIPFVPQESLNSAIGMARGINPGRVVWIYDKDACSWDGLTGNWWNDVNTHQQTIDQMMVNSISWLTGKSDPRKAWDTLFRNFNHSHSRGEHGYLEGEKIAVKINMNNYNGSALDNRSNSTPQVVLSLVRQLVYNAGVPNSMITIYDLSRYISIELYNKCNTEFPNICFMDNSGKPEKVNWKKYVIDYSDSIHWSQKLVLELEGGNATYLPTVVSQTSYLINLGNMKGHDFAGVTLCAKNHFGTFYSYSAKYNKYGPKAAGVHAYTAPHDFGNGCGGSGSWDICGRQQGTYNAMVDLMGHKDLGEKTLLFILDALYCPKSHTGLPVKWAMQPFNNNWTSSLFVSQDGVAIESVGIDFLRSEPNVNTNVYGTVDNYLHEAAQANNPPSGTFYDPEGDGTLLNSLGVHEHWNNANDKKYSRDLHTGNGIELVNENPMPLSESVIFSIPSGNIDPGSYLSLNCATPSASIFYTTDGSIPDKSSSLYNGPLLISSPVTIRAFAYCEDHTPSVMTSASYIINGNISSNFEINSRLFYPNPANSYIVINSKYLNPGYPRITIIDLTGRIVFDIKIPGTKIYQIDISRLLKGNYILTLRNGPYLQTEKFEKW